MLLRSAAVFCHSCSATFRAQRSVRAWSSMRSAPSQEHSTPSDASGRKRAMVRIGTHDGTFHCDEALGVYMLRRTAAFKDAEVVRTRVPEVLNDLDVVLDVGAVYDPARHRYDHHQKEFNDVFGHGFTTRLSSAGLVYKHFGREVIASLLGKSPEDGTVTTVWLQVYKTFMEAIDGIDNGVSQYEGKPKYLSNTNLSSRVGNLNPTWLQESTPALLDAQFEKAVQLAGSEWLETVEYTANVWLPGRAPVEQALAARHDVHPSGRIVQLMQYCPWKSHIYDLEQELGLMAPDKQPWFVLYEDEKKNWRVQAISVGPNSFENRKGLPTPWRGLRDEQLSAEAGVPGCIFVHVTGFIGGNATLQGAKDMAIKALALD